MWAVVQRVRSASVEVEGIVTGDIENGILVLLGIARNDREADAIYLLDKVLKLRIFPDERGKMNRDLLATGGGLLIVSQFTLYGECNRGRRPSFDKAAPAEQARRLYDYFVSRALESGLRVQMGVFQALMAVHLVNDGPVTLILESPNSGDK